MANALSAEVAVEGTTICFDRLYTYLIPVAMQSSAAVGCRVLVAFGAGKKIKQGCIFSVSSIADESESKKLKSIIQLLDVTPVLTPEHILLAERMRDRTFCTYYDAAKAMLPVGLNLVPITTYTLSPDISCNTDELTEAEKKVYDCLCSRGAYMKKDKILSFCGLDSDSDVTEKMFERGILIRNDDFRRKIGDATVKTAALACDEDELSVRYPKLTVKQKSVIDVLLEAGNATVKELCYFTGVTAAVITGLEKNGIIELSEEDSYRRPYEIISNARRDKVELTDEQVRAYTKLSKLRESGKYACGLLFGVTGSGKTKVYMRLIDDALDAGNGVILLVPEISLTPQALSIFYSRYGDRVAVVHSGLSMGERLDEWKRIKSGRADMVIGTRSAVFAPVKNPGLIIIDEEQEHTYKSEMSPRYDARDCALFRCKNNNALLVLASATPSIETYTSALNGRIALAELKKRYGAAQLPEIITVDMSERFSLISPALSRVLVDAIGENLSNSQQSLLLLNRRGFNTFVSCTSCKKVITCPNCSISLTYHSSNNRLLCHYCGYSVDFTDICPQCGEHTVRYSGFGTQRVEQELHELFPQASVLRMDADTTMKKLSHEKQLSAFARGEYDILIGTQMVAKGLDFPNVTLVGVISVDSQLYNDDFRSMEKTFDLLMQVVGRSGRGTLKGKAVIQTVSPDNDIICLAAAQDYSAYYNMEMSIRKAMIYPPYCDICTVNISALNENTARMSAKDFLEMLKGSSENEYQNEKIIVLGPVMPRVGKVNNKYRYRIIIKCKNSPRFREMIRELLKKYMREKKYRETSIYAQINPDSIN